MQRDPIGAGATSSRPPLPLLTTLRFFAAAEVVAFHVAQTRPGWARPEASCRAWCRAAMRRSFSSSCCPASFLPMSIRARASVGLQCEGDQVLAAAFCPHRSGLLLGASARRADHHSGRGAVAGVGLVGGVRHGVGGAVRAGVVAGLHDALELSRLVVVGGVPVLCALPLAGAHARALACRCGACGQLRPHRADERLRVELLWRTGLWAGAQSIGWC